MWDHVVVSVHPVARGEVVRNRGVVEVGVLGVFCVAGWVWVLVWRWGGTWFMHCACVRVWLGRLGCTAGGVVGVGKQAKNSESAVWCDVDRAAFGRVRVCCLV